MCECGCVGAWYMYMVCMYVYMCVYVCVYACVHIRIAYIYVLFVLCECAAMHVDVYVVCVQRMFFSTIRVHVHECVCINAKTRETQSYFVEISSLHSACMVLGKQNVCTSACKSTCKEFHKCIHTCTYMHSSSQKGTYVYEAHVPSLRSHKHK